MKDLIGPRGLKGDTGERGLPGKDSKCKCDLGNVAIKDTSISATSNIDSYPLKGGDGITFTDEKRASLTSGSAITMTPPEIEANKVIIADLKSQLLSISSPEILTRIQAQKEDITFDLLSKLEPAHIGKLSLRDIEHLADMDRKEPSRSHTTQRLAPVFIKKLTMEQIGHIPKEVFMHFTKADLETPSEVTDETVTAEAATALDKFNLHTYLEKSQKAAASPLNTKSQKAAASPLNTKSIKAGVRKKLIQLLKADQISFINSISKFNTTGLLLYNYTIEKKSGVLQKTIISDNKVVKLIQLLSQQQISKIPPKEIATLAKSRLIYDDSTDQGSAKNFTLNEQLNLYEPGNTNAHLIQLLTLEQIKVIPPEILSTLTDANLQLESKGVPGKKIIQLLTPEQINSIFSDPNADLSKLTILLTLEQIKVIPPGIFSTLTVADLQLDSVAVPDKKIIQLLTLDQIKLITATAPIVGLTDIELTSDSLTTNPDGTPGKGAKIIQLLKKEDITKIKEADAKVTGTPIKVAICIPEIQDLQVLNPSKGPTVGSIFCR